MRKRKRIALVELISKGSPKLFAKPGTFYSISPKVRKVADLKDHECGVKRLISTVDGDSSEPGLHLDPRVATMLAAHIDSAVKKHVEAAMEKTIEKLREENLGFTTSKDWDDYVALSDAKTVRVLVEMFVKSQIAKILLQELRSSVNKVYKKHSIPVKVTDVIAETKNLLVKSQIGTQDEKLSLIEAAIDSHLSSPTGKGFVEVMHTYLDANQLIHEVFNVNKLDSIQKQLDQGKTFNMTEEGRQWLSYIVTELIKHP